MPRFSNHSFLATTLSFLSSRAYPDFLSRVAASVGCVWFSLKRTTSGVAHDSSAAGNPGTLLMTKGRVGVSSGNWFEGSQVSKARPGAPFDFTLRCCRGYKLGRSSPDSLSASRLLGMTKRRGSLQG